MFHSIRKIIFILWIGVIISFGYYLSQHRELLDPEKLLLFFRGFWAWSLAIYILLSFVRGLVLLPSTPFVLVGVLFFPDQLWLVFFISMLGIVFSGALIYFFSDVMGFDEFFAPYLKNQKIEKWIKKYGFITIALWSFAPIVMTDLICYVAGIVRYSFVRFILALTLGESLMVGVLIYGGKEIFTLLGIG